MLKTKFKDSDTIDIPPKIAKKFALKDGIVVEAKVEKGKLLILRKKDKIRKFMQFAGMWKTKILTLSSVKYARIGTNGKRSCLYRY